MKKLLGLFVLLFAISCQKAELMERKDAEGSRGNEEVADTADVNVDVDAEGWAGSIDVGFEF